ncbi:MAG: CehA/McbA family metallohydrolase [Anaerolineae bacterium]|nr:CehA/McbA family metallohydrolase [Anaerolineae bacterium]NUQ03253.1 CehA/McbA family metallohydrolase [Anaerolineae bacterium]
MHRLPFAKAGRWYRGNLHTHSTRSDGRLSPEAVCRFYREHGYHFLAITDHFMDRFGYPITDTSSFRTPEFTTLFGAELHAGQTLTDELWHILAVGLPLDFTKPSADETGPQITQRALDAGAYVSVAHPAWYNLAEEDVISLKAAHSIEVINGISADHNDRINSWYMVDAMLARGYRFDALATDDAHFKTGFNDSLRGWTWVKTEALTPEGILEALKQGWVYNSTGPQIFDVQVRSGDSVKIRCSPASSIFVTGKGARAVQQHGNGITEIDMNIRRLDSPYCRVTVRDASGGRAWTNPIWL